jgi:hypothetical protein
LGHLSLCLKDYSTSVVSYTRACEIDPANWRYITAEVGPGMLRETPFVR